jgi:hypothetical protein
MTSDELKAIRQRIENASDGPWSVRRIPNSYESQAGDRHTHPCVRGFRVPRRLYNLAWQQCEADAEFMAQSRQDVPVLLAEVEHLRAVVEQCFAAVEQLAERPTVTADQLSQIQQYLAEETVRWDGGQRRPKDARRLYVNQAPLRPRDAVAALTGPRKVG